MLMLRSAEEQVLLRASYREGIILSMTAGMTYVALMASEAGQSAHLAGAVCGGSHGCSSAMLSKTVQHCAQKSRLGVLWGREERQEAAHAARGSNSQAAVSRLQLSTCSRLRGSWHAVHTYSSRHERGWGCYATLLAWHNRTPTCASPS